MKTKFLFFVSLFLLTIYGCQEDVVPEVVIPPVQKSSLEAWASPESVAYNGSATISWQSKNVTSLFVNGVKVSNMSLGTLSVSGMVRDSIFNFAGTGIDGNAITKSLTIKVGLAPAPTKLDTMKSLLGFSPWRMIKSIWFDGSTWVELGLSDLQLRQLWTFLPNGKYKKHDPSDGKIYVDPNDVGAVWEIKDLKYLCYGLARVDSIISLTEKELVLECKGTFDGTGKWVPCNPGRITYVH